LSVHPHRDRSGSRYHDNARPSIGRSIERNIAVTHKFDILDPQGLHQHIVHPGAHVFAADAREAHAGRDQIVAMDECGGTGLIYGLANRGSSVGNSNAQRI
jgi:hypothetical protein